MAEKPDHREAVQLNGDSPGRWGQTAWMWMSAPPPQPVYLQMSLSLSEPQSPPLQHGIILYSLHRLVVRFVEIVPATCLVWGLLKKNTRVLSLGKLRALAAARLRLHGHTSKAGGTS